VWFALIRVEQDHWVRVRPNGFFVGRSVVLLRVTGKVKWFNETKGYGFIKQDSGRDIFVHYSEIQEDGYKTLAEGETVEFELREGSKGLEATNVIRRPEAQV
jgi:CspA family cold shock protein